MNKELYNRITKFRDDRDWAQFHSGENLAKSICIEASELLEVFQWSEQEKSLDKVKEELADVLLYATLMADHYHLDIDEIMLNKLIRNEEKYPADLVKGSSKKYNEYKKK
jgi:NTP pyrophosphatase (non-canonical NTP hydrolase)